MIQDFSKGGQICFDVYIFLNEVEGEIKLHHGLFQVSVCDKGYLEKNHGLYISIDVDIYALT